MYINKDVQMASIESEDSELVEDHATARREEITALVRAHEGPLFRFLLALTGDQGVAGDCMQDTFVRAYEHLCRGRAVNAQWLYKVARNRGIDEIRRRRRETSDATALSALHTADTREDMTSLLQAFSALSPEDRAIIALAADGLSGEDIASRLGIRHGAVRMRLLRARERCRKHYEGNQP
jgi:RNA polymerase sigma-70 factor (ECF subfamily)